MEFSALEICKRDFESRPPRFDEKIHKASARVLISTETEVNETRYVELFARALELDLSREIERSQNIS